MKKTYLLALFILTVLFLAACDPVDQGEPQGRYYQGDVGLELSFVEGEPPQSVLDDGQEVFDISILVKNVGEEDIAPNDILVTLNGIERDAFKLARLTEKNKNELLGTKKLQDRKQEGDSDEIRFEDASYKDLLPFNFDVDIRADVCYEYGTTAVADVCLKSDTGKRRTNDQCQIDNGDVKIESSGAPVKVENFAQRTRGTDSIQFTFDIVKTGAGDVFPSGNFNDKCTTDDENEDMVDVSIDFIRANLPVSCTTFNGNEGTVRLSAGRKTVRCEVDTSSLQDIAFEKPLRIKLDYVYKDSVQKTFTVESTEDF